MLERTKVAAQVSFVFLVALLVATWSDRTADSKALRRPEWVRSEVATGPPTPGRLLGSSRGANLERSSPTPLAQDGSNTGVFARRFDAAGAPVGGEFQVNTYTTGAQGAPSATADKKGNLTVVWHSGDQDGSSFGVFGRRFDSTGTALGPEFAVNTYTTGGQAGPVVAADKKGNLNVLWSSGGQDGSSYGVFGRRFGPTGAALGPEFQVNGVATGSQGAPAVAADKKGNVTAFWNGPGDGSGYGVFGRRFDTTGMALGAEFPVNTHTTDTQSAPAVAADKKGNLNVFWQSSSGQDGDGFGVFGRRFDPSGAALGAEFPVNTHTTGNQVNPVVAIDKKGNVSTVWASNGQDGDLYGVFVRRFDPAGAPLGPEIQVNTYTTGYQSFQSVAADKNGNLSVVWDSGTQDGSNYGVFGRRFDSTGTALGPEFPVNTYTTGYQGNPSVAVDGKGNFFVVWVAG